LHRYDFIQSSRKVCEITPRTCNALQYTLHFRRCLFSRSEAQLSLPLRRLSHYITVPPPFTCLVRCSTATSFLVVQMRAKIADRVSLRSYSVLPTSCFSQPVVGALCRHCRIRGRFRARIMPSHPSREFRESPKPGITIDPSSAILEHTRRMCRRSRHRICRR
jgi:hypothetical protein